VPHKVYTRALSAYEVAPLSSGLKLRALSATLFGRVDVARLSKGLHGAEVRDCINNLHVLKKQLPRSLTVGQRRGRRVVYKVYRILYCERPELLRYM
jgi:hypothetical protein